MTDPIFIVAGAEILKLAFSEFIKTSAGEVSKKLTSEALTRANELQQEIVSWFKKKQNVRAEKAITAIQETGSLEALNKLTTYLDDEMEIEPIFAHNLQEMAQQIINIQPQIASGRQYNNYGKDQINIEYIKGDPKIGGQ